MGKPTNTRSAGCAVTTSNCVVWQGPDLCCIDLCHGDTVSDVVDAIAKKICKIFEMLNINSYDVSDLITTECPPGNFVELIQLLIDQVALIKSNPSGSNSTTSGCPECEMAVATCFQRDHGAVLSMTDYITAIGVKLCDQEVVIKTQNNALAQMQLQIAALQAQVNLLIGG